MSKLIIFLFFFPVVIFSQLNLKSIIKKELKKTGAKLKKYELIKTIDIKDYNEGFTITNTEDSIQLKEIIIDKDISLFTYKFTPSDYKQFHEDFFRIKGINYKIDSIILSQGVDTKYYNPYFFLRSCLIYEGKENNKSNFFLIEANNRTFYRNKEVLSAFLIYINQKEVIIKILYDLN
jgi:hypothetical protein